MARTGSGRGRRRELAVLALSIGSAAALVWVAVGAVQGSDAAGEFALQRRAGEVADAVRAEWGRLLDESRPPAEARGERFEWTAGEAPARSVEHRTPSAAGSASSSVLATLLSESERLELIRAEPAAALDTVLEGIASDPDSPYLPEARLRAIQLAARVDRGEVVDAQWAALREECGWELARGDTSFVLLAALAAANVWPAEQRLAAQAEILAAWTSGAVALPLEAPRLEAAEDGVRIGPVARAAGLRERVRALAPSQDSAAALDELERRERFAALTNTLGHAPEPDRAERWQVSETPLGPFVVRRARGDHVEGFFTTHSELARRLESRLRLPDGFAFDFGGDADELGARVRDATELPGSAMAFHLRNRDPQRIVRAARERAGFLRAALLVLAVLSGAAGATTFRAMRRQRRLGELKTGFIAGVSHDLRTPLASILLMAENLESGRVAGERATHYYGAIRREADRLRRLVDDVLDFSRIERGERAKLCREPVDLRVFASDVAAEARAKVEAAGLVFTADVDGIEGEGALDPDAVRRALWNLIDNALAHSGSDAITLRGARPEPDTLTLAVTDRGGGVPARMREEVFRPFVQLGGAAGTGSGTGLGLAIVREIARAHGGDARVADGPGGIGTTFEMHLDLSGANGLQEDGA